MEQFSSQRASIFKVAPTGFVALPQPPLEHGDGAPGPGIHVHQLAGVLWRRKRLVALVTLLGVLLAGIAGLLTPPIYIASAQLIVEPPQRELNGTQATTSPTAEETAIDTHVMMLTSEGHLRRVLDALVHEPAFQPPPAQEVGERAILQTLQSELGAWTKRMSAKAAALLRRGQPGRPDREEGAQERPDGVPRLTDFKRVLKVNQERKSRVITVSYSANHPDKAAVAANQMAKLHVDTLAEKRRTEGARVLDWLTQRIPELKTEVEQAETAVQTARIVQGVSNGLRPDELEGQVADLRRQVALAETDASAREARLERIRDLRSHKDGREAIVALLDTPSLTALQRQALAVEAQFGPVSASGEGRTGAIPSEEPSARLAAAIEREIHVAITRLEGDVKVARAQVNLTQQRIEALQRAGTQDVQGKVGVRLLERQAAAVAQIYESLLRRRTETTEQQQLLGPDIRILELATSPERPSSLHPIFFLPPAFAAFLIMGSLLAIAVDRFDGRLRGEDETSHALGIPCVGLVPEIRSARGREVYCEVLEERFSPYSKAIRALVASVLQPSGSDAAPKVIVTTSSLPGEGKTTLAISFGICAARLGRRVLLIDFDVSGRNPSGPLSADQGSVDPEHRSEPHEKFVSAINKIPNLGLDYLAAADLQRDPLALFADDEIHQALHVLGGSYDVIVIDGPPVHATPEARLLPSLGDRVLFAVRWGATSSAVARNAVDAIRGLETCGAVLTRVDLRKHARYGFGDAGEFLFKFRKHYAPTSGG